MGIDINAIKKAANAAVENSDKGNMHEAKTTERELPAAGNALARLVGVVEIGEQEVPAGPNMPAKVKDRIRYVFELFGKKYPRHKTDDGREIPVRISRSITNSRHEKSTQYAWVSEMDKEKKYSHPVQMIGDSFIVNIEHKKVPDGNTIAFIKEVKAAEKEDLDTGEVTPLEAPEPVSDYMIFLWDNPTLEMWNSLFIEGEFDGKTRNIFQDMISKALNFDGSPVAKMLEKAISEGKDVTGVGEDAPQDNVGETAVEQNPDLGEVDAVVDAAADDVPQPTNEQEAVSARSAKEKPAQEVEGMEGQASSRLASLVGDS